MIERCTHAQRNPEPSSNSPVVADSGPWKSRKTCVHADGSALSLAEKAVEDQYLKWPPFKFQGSRTTDTHFGVANLLQHSACTGEGNSQIQHGQSEERWCHPSVSRKVATEPGIRPESSCPPLTWSSRGHRDAGSARKPCGPPL